MTQTLRFAVIGAGAYAGAYHIPHLAANPDVDLRALCSADPADLAQKAERYRVPATFVDYRQLLTETALDAIVVSSPHALHFDHCLAGLERGLHVLVDKAPVLRAGEWQELTSLAERTGRVLMPALNRHLEPSNLYARSLIQSGALGEVFFARSNQVGYPRERSYTSLALAGGGPLVGRGSHMAALIPWLTGWQASAVTALLTHESLEVDTGGIVNVRATNGALFQIASVRTGYRDVDEVDVFGSAGGCRVERPVGQRGWRVSHHSRGGEEVPIGVLPAGKTTTDHFVDVVLDRAPILIPPEDGRHAVEIVEAAYESARAGTTIRLREG